MNIDNIQKILFRQLMVPENQIAAERIITCNQWIRTHSTTLEDIPSVVQMWIQTVIKAKISKNILEKAIYEIFNYKVLLKKIATETDHLSLAKEVTQTNFLCYSTLVACCNDQVENINMTLYHISLLYELIGHILSIATFVDNAEDILDIIRNFISKAFNFKSILSSPTQYIEKQPIVSELQSTFKAIPCLYSKTRITLENGDIDETYIINYSALKILISLHEFLSKSPSTIKFTLHSLFEELNSFQAFVKKQKDTTNIEVYTVILLALSNLVITPQIIQYFNIRSFSKILKRHYLLTEAAKSYVLLNDFKSKQEFMKTALRQLNFFYDAISNILKCEHDLYNIFVFILGVDINPI